MKLRTIEIRSRKIDVEVDGSGEFSAEYNGQEIHATTLDLLKEKLDRAVKADKIEPIRFIYFDGEKLKRGACTGIHVGNGNILIKWEGEKGVEQEYSMRGCLDPERYAEYKKLCDAVIEAEQIRSSYQSHYGFDDLKERVKTAINAVVDGAK
jgi:hypothetical protein